MSYIINILDMEILCMELCHEMTHQMSCCQVGILLKSFDDARPIIHFSIIALACRFRIPLEQVWESLVVHPALLLQAIKQTLVICLQYLYQEQIILHPLLPLQHPVAHLYLEMLGSQVHGIRNHNLASP